MTESGVDLGRVANRNRARASSENAWLLSSIMRYIPVVFYRSPAPQKRSCEFTTRSARRPDVGQGFGCEESFNATTPSHYILKVEISSKPSPRPTIPCHPRFRFIHEQRCLYHPRFIDAQDYRRGGMAAALADHDPVARLGEHVGPGKVAAPVRFRFGGDGHGVLFRRRITFAARPTGGAGAAAGAGI